MYPQDPAAIAAMTGGYYPLAPGLIPPYRSGFDGLPIPGGMLGQIAFGTMGRPALMRFAHRNGMTPLGFGHDINAYDYMRQMQYNQVQEQAIREAAQADIPGMMDAARGIAHVTGTPWGVRQQAAARTLASGFASAAPMLVQTAPDLVDRMAGPYGSAAVLASRMIDAGRYRIDPVTGEMGMTAQSVGRMAESVVYDARKAGYSGFSAGRVGLLAQELQARGMMPTASTEYGPDGRMFEGRRAISDLDRLSPEQGAAARSRQGVRALSADKLDGSELDKLMLDPAVGDRMRSFDADRMKRTLRSYAQAVAAVRDVFGDNGRPNAPMSELMAGLDRMTAGAGSQLDPSRLAEIVRRTHNLAKDTGMPLANAMVVQQHGAATAAAYGLDPLFGLAGGQGGMAWGGAYRGLGMGAIPMWGQGSADQLMAQATAMRTRGSASPAANALDLVMRVHDTAGGFAPGTAAHAAAQAIKFGESSYVDPTTGQTKSLKMSPEDVTQLLGGASNTQGVRLNLSPGDVSDMLRQQKTNQEYGFRWNTQNVNSKLQAGDLLRNAAANATIPIRAAFGDGAVNEAYGVAEEILDKMPQATFADAKKRNAAIGKYLRSKFAAQTANMSDAQLDQLSERIYGQIDLSFQEGPYRDTGSAPNARALISSEVRAHADRQTLDANLKGKIQNATSGLASHDMLSSVVGALQRATGPDAAKEVVASAFGLVKGDRVIDSLRGPLEQMATARTELEARKAEILKTTDPAAREALQRRYDLQIEEYGSLGKSLNEMMRTRGLTVGGLSEREIGTSVSANIRALRGQADVAGYVAGVGGAITDAQVSAAAKLHKQAVDPAVAREVILARRKLDLDNFTPEDIEKTRKSFNGGLAELTDDQVKVMIRRSRVEGMNEIHPAVLAAEAESLNLEPNADPARQDILRRAAVRGARFSAATMPGEADIANVRSRYDISQDDAYELAAGRLRIRRLGLDQEFATRLDATTWEDVNQAVSRNPATAALAGAYAAYRRAGGKNEPGTVQGPHGPITLSADQLARYQAASTQAESWMARNQPNQWMKERAAIDATVAESLSHRYDISNTDRESWSRKTKITPEMRDAFRAARPDLVGLADDKLDWALRDTAILGDRRREEKKRLGSLWDSHEGNMLREQAAGSLDSTERHVDAILNNPEGAARFGAGGVDLAVALRKNLNEIRELAAVNAKGDIARLTNRDYDFDDTTPDGQKRYADVTSRVGRLQDERADLLKKLHGLSANGSPLSSVADAETNARRMLGADAKDIDVQKLAAKLRAIGGSTDQDRLDAGNVDRLGKRLSATAKSVPGVSDIDGLRRAVAGNSTPGGMTVADADQVRKDLGEYDAAQGRLDTSRKRIDGRIIEHYEKSITDANGRITSEESRTRLPATDFSDLDSAYHANEAYRARLAAENQPKADATADALIKAYGFTASDREKADLAQMLSTGSGAHFGKRAAESRAAMAAAAKKGNFGSIRNMFDAHGKARKDGTEGDFFRSIGAHDEDSMRAFIANERFQNSALFSKSGDGLNELRSAIQSAEGLHPQASRSSSGPVKLEGTLTLIGGNKVDLAASTTSGELGMQSP